jgi:hypothetical protein
MADGEYPDMPRTLVSAQNTPDQFSYQSGANVGFGNAGTPYRGQVFQPSVSTLQAVGFWLIDAVGGIDYSVTLCTVDQSLQTPTGNPFTSPLASWIIPAASLVSGAFTVYPLSPAYTGLVPGTKYGIFFGPSQNGAWVSSYRGVTMHTSGVVFPNSCKEMTYNGTSWSTENISWFLATYGPASRTKNPTARMKNPTTRTKVT